MGVRKCPSVAELAELAVALREQAEEETEASLRYHSERSDLRAGLAADRATSLRKAARLVQQAAEVLVT